MSAEGTPLRLSNVSRRWWRPLLKRAAAAAEQEARAAGDETYRFPSTLGLNALRHTSFELQPLAGIDYDVASERGGHASVTTTYRHYREIAEQRHREAAEQIDNFIASSRRAVSDAVGGRVGGSRPHPASAPTTRENEKPLIDKGFSNGSGCWTRTNDPLINRSLRCHAATRFSCKGPSRASHASFISHLLAAQLAAQESSNAQFMRGYPALV
jgi:hypothetical protein